MRFTRLVLLALALCAAVLGTTARDAAAVVGAEALAEAPQKVGVLPTPNVTRASRTAQDIDQVVVHITEGSFWGSVQWLRNPRARASAHYVISKQGEIVQLVDPKDVSWHAGNKATNYRSIGIEHEGLVSDRGFTDAQYEASARLAAYLSQRYAIKLDRKHLIGHREVPHPSGRGKGGANRKTCPGDYWRWPHYMALVKKYVQEPQAVNLVTVAPPAAPRPAPAPRAEHGPAPQPAIVCGRSRSVHFANVEAGAKVAGIMPWRAKICGRGVSRVEFFLNGERIGRDGVWPFQLAGGRGLNTTELVNGWHTLTLRAVFSRGHVVTRSIRVRVANSPFAVAPAGLGDGQAIHGSVRFQGWTTAPAKQVELVRDGEVVASGRGRGTLEWDTTTVPDGEHQLELRALAVDGRTASRPVPVLVSNGDPEAGPAAARAPHVLWHSLSDWQSITGPVVWQALADGEIQQVEFWVSGRLRWVAKEPPYSFGGPSGLWDPSTVRPGRHNLMVRVVGAGTRVAEARATVFVGTAG